MCTLQRTGQPQPALSPGLVALSGVDSSSGINLFDGDTISNVPGMNLSAASTCCLLPLPDRLGGLVHGGVRHASEPGDDLSGAA